MATTITIGGADKTGALARLTTFLARKGYGLRGHQIAESASGGKLLKFTLDEAKVDRDELSAEIKGLCPDYSIVNVASEGTDIGSAGVRGKPAQPGSAAIKEMASRFPDIAPLVHAYGDSLKPEAREQELFEAGKKIGAFNYSKEWSFGSPLKMPVALRRALVPALEKLGQVDATDTSITLLDSAYCGPDRMNCCCEFLTGFMQGFLDASPTTKNTRVQKVTCRATGGLHCTYAVNYTVEA